MKYKEFLRVACSLNVFSNISAPLSWNMLESNWQQEHLQKSVTMRQCQFRGSSLLWNILRKLCMIKFINLLSLKEKSSQ